MFSGLWYLLCQEYQDIRDNLADCFDWKGGDTVVVRTTKTTMKAKGKYLVVTDRLETTETAVTMTCEQAATRHGVEDGRRSISRMCLRGQALAKKYGGASKVPEAQKKTALFAKKVGKCWFIPVTELDRVFLP